ncbi:MAG: hypothetical protein IKS49_05120 [Actinomycetaceae bacterium]|nr:hypothetical protein [Actinomycetaceae bacterium]
MGTYYYFHLEKKSDNDTWHPIKVDDSDYFHYVRNHAREFVLEYGSYSSIGFQNLNEEYKKANQEKYDAANDFEKHYIANFELMDLERIKEDYDRGLHEYGGIISRHSFKLLQSNMDYCPKIIDEEVYAAFKDDVKENYMYHEWDTFYGEYYYLYEIMPKVNKILKEENLTLDDVRLLCRVS